MIQLLLFSLDKMMFSFFHKSTKDPLLISKPNIELISFSHSVSAEKSSQIEMSPFSERFSFMNS